MAYQETIYGTCVSEHAHADLKPKERYEVDIHTHTIASGHGSSATITDMAKAAKAASLKMLGISDHGPATLGGGRISYFRNLKYAQRERLGIRMLWQRGAKASMSPRRVRARGSMSPIGGLCTCTGGESEGRTSGSDEEEQPGWLLVRSTDGGEPWARSRCRRAGTINGLLS